MNAPRLFLFFSVQFLVQVILLGSIFAFQVEAKNSIVYSCLMLSLSPIRFGARACSGPGTYASMPVFLENSVHQSDSESDEDYVPLQDDQGI